MRGCWMFNFFPRLRPRRGYGVETRHRGCGTRFRVDYGYKWKRMEFMSIERRIKEQERGAVRKCESVKVRM
jgi:hypothetical protein